MNHFYAVNLNMCMYIPEVLSPRTNVCNYEIYEHICIFKITESAYLKPQNLISAALSMLQLITSLFSIAKEI